MTRNHPALAGLGSAVTCCSLVIAGLLTGLQTLRRGGDFRLARVGDRAVRLVRAGLRCPGGFSSRHRPSDRAIPYFLTEEACE